MKSIDLLEHGGELTGVIHAGEHFALPDPRRKHYQWVLMALAVGHVPGIPGDIPEWKRALVFDRWCAAWNLPTFNNARRLAYLVDHYRAEISSDLATYANLDLGDLWRERRWLLLLDVIDRLPAHSHYSAAASMDEEHVEMVARSIAEANSGDGDSAPSGPPLTTWTPEVAVLTSVLDAVNRVQHAVVAVQAEKGKAPDAPKPMPRPMTPLQKALERAEFRRRKEAHEALVARVLPQKKHSRSPVH